MTTTREALEGMRRANWLRAKRPDSSMHKSWLDAAALEQVTREFFERKRRSEEADALRRERGDPVHAPNAAAPQDERDDGPETGGR